MSPEPRLALIIVSMIVVLASTFILGAWWGSHDRLCVTAPSSHGTIVWCASGTPAGDLGQ